jgi:3-oxoacyl-[acyl-carrier-protein] synthase I
MSEGVHLNFLGIVCALGSGKDAVARRLFNGDSGVIPLEHAVVDGTTLPFAPITDPLPAIPRTGQQFASRNLAIALQALEEIDEDIRRAIDRYGRDRVAVVMGTSTSGISAGEDALSAWICSSNRELPDGFDFLQQEIGSVAESIAVHYGLEAPAITISTACSSSAKVLVTSRLLLRQGVVDAVIAGGCDSRCRLTLNGFYALSAVAAHQCLPFSANRDGIVIGEGAAIFLITREPIGPEICGIGESSDAYNMTAPEPGGAGARAAMLAALADAGIDPEQVCYVNLHGTGTELNDAMESLAIRAVFPEAIRCSSSKAQIGHTLGAAGAIEAGLCWLTLQGNPAGRLPPHVWDHVPDPDARLPGLVATSDRLILQQRPYVMSNSYAFGGSNISILLGSADGE